MQSKGPSSSTLVIKNVWVGDRRTSLRLEPDMWDAMDEISQREDCTVHDLCTWVDEHREQSSLTAAIRVFICGYFRTAATEQGHRRAGHGGIIQPRLSQSRPRLRRSNLRRQRSL